MRQLSEQKETSCCRCWRSAYLERSCLAATAGKGELVVISTLSSALPAVAVGGASDCLLHSCRAAKGCLAALRAKALCPKGSGEVASSVNTKSAGEGQEKKRKEKKRKRLRLLASI